MAKDPEIGIGLNPKGFVNGAKQAQDAINKLANTRFGQISKGISNLGKDLGGVATKIGKGLFAGGALLAGAPAAGAALATGIVAGINKAIGPALEEAQINGRMKQVFGAMNFDFLDAVANKVKSAFAFDDGDTKKAMNVFGQMGMSAQQAGKSISLAADVARAKNISIEASAKLIGKAYQGNTKAAAALGLEVTKTGDPLKDQANLMQQIQQRYGGAAAEFAKNMSPFAKLKLAIDDMIENVGAKLIPLVMPFLTWVSETLQSIVSNDGFVDGIVAGFKTAYGFAKQIGTTIVTYGLAIFDFVKQLPAAFGKMWDSGNLVSLLVDIVGGLMVTVWQAIVALGKMLWAAIISGIPALVGLIGKALIDLLRSALGDRVSKILGLDKAAEGLNEVMKVGAFDVMETSKEAMKQFGAQAKENFAGIGGIAKDAFAGAGANFDASLGKAQGQVKGLSLMSGMRDKVARDTADLYGMTGDARSIGISKTAAQNAAIAKAKASKGAKYAAAQNKRNKIPQRIQIDLQSADRINPVMAAA